MRIALFCSFSPESGAGSVPLRGYLEQLSDIDIHWYYLSYAPAHRAKTQYLGKPFSELQLASDLAARAGLPGSTSTARRIADQLDADRFWVVGHYEGVSVAAELLQRGKHVHLSVQDDPICMFRRSRRYRLLVPLMERHFANVITGAKSVDVISNNMRDAYRGKYKIDSIPAYRYVAALPNLERTDCPATTTLRIGHIGSLYHTAPLRIFMEACQAVAKEKDRGLKIVRIGSSPEIDRIASEKPALFDHKGELNEDQAIQILASCDLVYAMYPPGTRFQCFRRTSLPMKMSTYIQAQRPIFAHTPPDSGLSQVVEQFRIGKVCSSENVEEIKTALHQLLDDTIEPGNFESARQQLMGKEQVDALRAALLG
jgi:hypothetical protein